MYKRQDSIYISDGIYYNPAKEENKKLIVSGVKEIVKNYDVDGCFSYKIHQHVGLVFLVFQEPAFGVKFQIEA